MMHGFYENMKLIVGMSGINHYIILYFIICITISTVSYVESNYMALIMTDSENVYYYLLVIGVFKMMNPLFTYADEIVYRKYIMTRIINTAHNYYWNLTISAHPKWLESNKNINKDIQKGVGAITQTFGQIATLARPVFKLVSAVFFIMSLTRMGFVTVIGSIIIVVVGYYLTYQNHLQLKLVEIKHSCDIAIADNQSKNIINRVLNYKGQQTVDNIISAYTNKDADVNIQKIKGTSKFVLLDLLTSFIQLSSVAVIVYHSDIKFTPIIYMTVNTIRCSAWCISCLFRMISERSSGWGSLEKSLDSYTSYTKCNTTMQHNIPMASNEVQLFGPSGCGKTTFMKRTVIDIFVNSYPGQFIYMDQHMRLIQTKRSILSVMGDDLEFRNQMNIQVLLYYAQVLKIDNIININTLQTPFVKPSGGEEKRIMILRTLFPLIIGNHQVKVVFNDEITSGLDYDNWCEVRSLINMLKQQGIKFVTIDHHPNNVEKITINKQIVDSEIYISIC
jgi:ABC-type lipoprotein export system ATPase subunit